MNIVNLNNNNKSPYTQKAAFKANIPDTSRTIEHLIDIGLIHAFDMAVVGKSEKGVTRELRKIQSFINQAKGDLYASYNKISNFIVNKAFHRIRERPIIDPISLIGKHAEQHSIRIRRGPVIGIIDIGHHTINRDIALLAHSINSGLPGMIALFEPKPISILSCEDHPIPRIVISELLSQDLCIIEKETGSQLGLKNNHEAMKPIKPTKINLYKRHFGIHNRKW